METTDAQVRKLMEEFQKHGQVGVAALRSGMHRNTARKYLRAQKVPSELKGPRQWRTRQDPFEQDWPWIVERLEAAPELEAKSLFEALMERWPDRYQEGQLRTLQRRLRRWRAEHGPAQEVFFAQQHRPGEAMQTDFTDARRLGITIAGKLLVHLLCHMVLPHSNWQWATVCFSESMSALRRGVQEAIFRLGRVPRFHQTDNTTAATHTVRSGLRAFNPEYEALMRHLGMEPRTITVGRKEQNGDVEAANGALKRCLEQHLLLRGSRDFDSQEAYEQWVQSVLEKANRRRQKKLRGELAAMRELGVDRLVEYSEEPVRVGWGSTLRVKSNTYSVPSRLIGRRVRVRIYETRLEVFYGGTCQAEIERLRGIHGHRIDYRHVIDSLVRKPGAFARYRYREELFPSVAFRRAYDRLREQRAERSADLEYLRLLHLAARTMQSDVEGALELLEAEGQCPTSDAVRDLVCAPPPQVPELTMPPVDLQGYDALLGREVGP